MGCDRQQVQAPVGSGRDPEHRRPAGRVRADHRRRDGGDQQSLGPGSAQLTVVPRLEGLLDSQVGPLLEAANLQYGAVWNPTKEHHTDRLRVISQDPAAGDSVPVGTRVNYSVELAHQQQGVKSIVLTNAHQQGRAVEVFLWDSSVGGWSSQGNLGVDASVTLSLASGRIYTVVAVDRGLGQLHRRPARQRELPAAALGCPRRRLRLADSPHSRLMGSLNFEQFVEGHRWVNGHEEVSKRCTSFAGDEPCNGEEIRCTSSRFDALQSVRN